MNKAITVVGKKRQVLAQRERKENTWYTKSLVRILNLQTEGMYEYTSENRKRKKKMFVKGID